MTKTIRGTAEVAIPAGKIQQFKQLAAEIIARVAATEPGTLSYEYFFSPDESKAYVVQAYEDSEALLFHLQNIADLAGPFHQLAPLTGVTIFGNPSAALRQALEPVGAQIFEHWDGLTR
jgi:quinol monooxygenase YgiN